MWLCCVSSTSALLKAKPGPDNPFSVPLHHVHATPHTLVRKHFFVVGCTINCMWDKNEELPIRNKTNGLASVARDRLDICAGLGSRMLHWLFPSGIEASRCLDCCVLSKKGRGKKQQPTKRQTENQQERKEREEGKKRNNVWCVMSGECMCVYVYIVGIICTNRPYFRKITCSDWHLGGQE